MQDADRYDRPSAGRSTVPITPGRDGAITAAAARRPPAPRTAGQQLPQLTASAAAALRPGQVVHGQTTGPPPAAAHVSATVERSALRRGPHLLQRHDAALDHLQQRFDRQRRRQQRGRRADPSAPPQVLERVDVERVRVRSTTPVAAPCTAAARHASRANRAAASTANPSPIAVARESTTRTTPCAEILCGQGRPTPRCPTRPPPAGSTRHGSAPPSSSRWYTSANSAGDGRGRGHRHTRPQRRA